LPANSAEEEERKMKRHLGLSNALLALLSLTLLACERPQDPTEQVEAGQLLIRGAGATFPEPLYERWMAEYQKENADAKFTYEGVGSGEGIKRFIAEEIDFGASDAAMKDEEIAQVARGVHLLPMTGGMVVLAYNIPGLEGALNLPRDVYADILLGKIYRWDDPRIAAANPEIVMPPRLIQVVARRDSSGTTFALTNHLAAISSEWRDTIGVGKQIDWPGGAMVSKGNEGVAQRIKITQNSIGYVEYGFAKRLGLPMARLQNKAGAFVTPSAQSGQVALAAGSESAPQDLRLYIPDPDGAESYPVVTYTWLLVYGDYPEAAKSHALREALRWGLDNGQQIAEEMGYIPLPENIRQRTQAVVDQLN
jgi:phosphate transport system substrate-binding protein